MNNWYVLGPSPILFLFFSDRHTLKFLKMKCNSTNKNWLNQYETNHAIHSCVPSHTSFKYNETHVTGNLEILFSNHVNSVLLCSTNLI